MKRTGFALILCLAAAFVITRPAWPQASGFVIDGADQTFEMAMTGAPLFPLSVAPKFTIDTGDSTVNMQLAPLPFTLPAITPKFIIDNADLAAYWTLAPLPFTLPAIAGKFIIDNADSTVWMDMGFPKDFYNDTIPPVIVIPPVVTQRTGTLVIIWTTDEYTVIKIWYGAEPGVYPYFVEIVLFAKTHQVTISLPPELQSQSVKTLYYKIELTDRSGNISATGEYQHEITQPPPAKEIYLPFTRR
jgi:hypothetical protein